MRWPDGFMYSNSNFRASGPSRCSAASAGSSSTRETSAPSSSPELRPVMSVAARFTASTRPCSSVVSTPPGRLSRMQRVSACRSAIADEAEANRSSAALHPSASDPVSQPTARKPAPFIATRYTPSCNGGSATPAVVAASAPEYCPAMTPA